MNKKKYYYNFAEDLDAHPDCWCYIIFSGRNTGKTFSVLKVMYDRDYKFGFTKRTNEDVDILCKSDSQQGGARFNLSPWTAIEREYPEIQVKASKVMKGIGAFHKRDPEGEAIGFPIGYIYSLNAIGDIKGFNQEADFLIFDEFIPKPWERVNRHEGDQLLDLYKTLDRDRIHRGLPATKLVCLANSTEINNPVFSILEIVDLVAAMDNEPEYLIVDRGIMIRKIGNTAFKEVEEKHPMFEALKNTKWGQMAMDGSFAYNDFSLVQNVSLKGATPYLSFTYKNKEYYVYLKNGMYYACSSRFNQNKPHYNLDKETEQQKYWFDYGYELRLEALEGKMLFQTYTLYDVIFNFKRIFRL